MPRGSHSYSIHTFHAVLLVTVTLAPTPADAQSTSIMPRVRSEDASIAQLLADAPAMSATFRGLVAAIDATDGIVYVQSGRCGGGARACLAHSLQLARPHRILRVLISPRRDRPGLIGAIGHELHHALEVLHDVNITTAQGMFFHFFGASTSMTNRFETKEAIDAGARIEDEVRTATKGTRGQRQLGK
jgi:hypothetical protein